MASTSDFRNGLILNHKSSLWKIVEFLHVKPGKGPAFVRTKLKNIKTGQIVDETFRAGQKIQTVRVEAKDYNYIYNDGNGYFFMDAETFEQISLLSEEIENLRNEITTLNMALEASEEEAISKNLEIEILGERVQTN